MRLTVFLPFATEGQIRAGTIALRELMVRYPDASVIGLGDDGVVGSRWWTNFESVHSRPSLRPACHGIWLNQETKEVEYDSHLMFISYAEETEETLPGAIADLEEMIYTLYYGQAVLLREPKTYQNLVFVEAWQGVHVVDRRRYGLRHTLA